MDPVAHTLFGATLAETGLRRLTRYATPTLLIGVNLPDIDALATFLGRDTSLHLRRGWTHGVLAMVVLPLVLAGCIWVWHRFRGREGPAPRWGWVVGLAYLSTLSHPLLDWMNTYGVRLLMPFDDRWFYGDTLFIIDPWFWLLTAAGVVAARSSTRGAIIRWSILGGLASLLVLGVPLVPVGVKIVWVVGVAAVIAIRKFAQAHHQAVARAGLATLVLYICAAFGLARISESDAASGSPQQVQANPMPGVPFQHRVVLVRDDYYEVVPADGPTFRVQRQAPDAVVQAALSAPSVRGFTTWMRFPYWTVIERPDGWTVELRDLRYVDPGAEPRGIGFARVELDRDLQPVD